MNDAAFLQKGFSISTDKDLIDFDAVFKYLSEDSYWAKGITADRLRRGIDNSLCFGVYKDDLLAGFTRVITDKATFAYLCDVFILPDFRKLGLSKWLMQTIAAHPDLQGLRRWSLATADAHGLYGQFGFTKLSSPDKWMEIYSPYLSHKKEGEQNEREKADL